MISDCGAKQDRKPEPVGCRGQGGEFRRRKRRSGDDQGRQIIDGRQENVFARIGDVLIHQGCHRETQHPPSLVDIARRIPPGDSEHARWRQMIEEGAPALKRVKTIFGQ